MAYCQTTHILRSTLFWDITQRLVTNPCRRFGTTYRSHLQGSRIQDVALEDRTDRSSRNVGKHLPPNAVWYIRTARISFTSRQSMN